MSDVLDREKSWKGRVKVVICKNCGKIFETRCLNRIYCSDKCRDEYRGIVKAEKIKKLKEPKIKRMDIVAAIAKVTGLHYGIVSSLYQNIEKILAKAKYEQSIGNAKPLKQDEYRKINISKEHTSCFLLGC